jgi:aspartate/methionine/tyrosine aminotransferase
VPVKPDGAFYIYGDISAHSQDSSIFSSSLLHGARVAAVAGLDFGPAHASNTMRFAYTTNLERLEEAVHRMKAYLS